MKYFKANIDSPLANVALSTVNKCIDGISPEKVMANNVRLVNKKTVEINSTVIDLVSGRLFVIGWGKASFRMAETFESIVGPDKIHDGIVISNRAKDGGLNKIKALIGGHPYPTGESIESTKELLTLVEDITENDYVVCLISGGGSSMLVNPVKEISLENISQTVDVMLKAGVEDFELNYVRKCLSNVKGGKLAKLLYPTRVINLVISDDPDNSLGAIASGATISDNTTFFKAYAVLNNYYILDKVPVEVRIYLEKKLNNEDKLNINDDSEVFNNVSTTIISDNGLATGIIVKELKGLGFDDIYIHEKTFTRNPEKSLKKFLKPMRSTDKSIAIVGGGEIPVVVKKNGSGGRCQHLAAMAMPYIKSDKNSVFLACSTDGRDYLDGVAGAMIDNSSYNYAQKEGLSVEKMIKGTNSYVLHKEIGTLVHSTSPTGNNVSDIYIYLRVRK